MLRVLVTRPQPAAAATAAKIRALGHRPLILPLAEARHDVGAASDGLNLNPASLVVTSAETIRVLAGLGDRIQPHLQTPLFAVGSATAEAARALGFQTIKVGPGTGERLAALVIEHAATPRLYLTGTPRSTAFQEALSKAGAPIIVQACYHMMDIDPPDETLAAAFSEAAPDAVLLYSPESARRFFDLPYLRDKPILLEQTRFLCISQAVARIVPPIFNAAVEVGKKPDETSLLALL